MPPWYYRYLGPPAFFHHPVLSTVPFLMGHDNQWWRDLLGDQGPVCRWWCSEHHLLKAESTASFLSHLPFILDLFILLSAWLCCTLPSCHHAYTLVSAWMTCHLPLIIMLTLICHSHLLLQTLPPQLCSLYTQLHSPYFHISFYIFTGLKGSLTYLYQASPADVL